MNATNSIAATEMPVHTDDAALIEFLEDRDVVCPLCGYNLRGLTSSRCPECGRGLRLSVGLAEPHLAAWIWLAVAAFASGGSGALFAILILREGFPPAREPLLRAAIFYFLTGIPASIITIKTRRRFLRLAPKAQWRIAIAYCAITLLGFVALAAGLR